MGMMVYAFLWVMQDIYIYIYIYIINRSSTINRGPTNVEHTLLLMFRFRRVARLFSYPCLKKLAFWYLKAPFETKAGFLLSD